MAGIVSRARRRRYKSLRSRAPSPGSAFSSTRGCTGSASSFGKADDHQSQQATHQHMGPASPKKMELICLLYYQFVPKASLSLGGSRPSPKRAFHNWHPASVVEIDSPLQHRGYPKQQVCPDFIRINLIQHLMPSARIEMMRDVRETCATIATHEDPKALQLLAHGVFTAGKEVNGQCAPYRSKAAGIGQLRSGGQEGLHRGRRECSKA